MQETAPCRFVEMPAVLVGLEEPVQKVKWMEFPTCVGDLGVVNCNPWPACAPREPILFSPNPVPLA